MSTDFAEKERAFVAALEADTGRSLAVWMQAIAECGLSERNDIIDWLRHQRFAFAKASWLERIHNNGGKLIYGNDALAGTTAAAAAADATPADATPAPPADAPAPETKLKDSAEPPRTAATAVETARPAVLEPEVVDALAAAKGLRPLAEMILREIRFAAPDCDFYVEGGCVMAAGPIAFAALLPAPKKLKLYADFGNDPAGTAVAADMVNRQPPPFARMVAIDDARRVDEAFRALLRELAPPIPVQRRA